MKEVNGGEDERREGEEGDEEEELKLLLSEAHVNEIYCTNTQEKL